MGEFNPLEEFSKLFHHWWMVAICMMIGALIAYVYHISQPPVYEATTTIMATIDPQSFPFQDVREDLIQYNEDMALGTVEGVLRSPEVTQNLISAADAQGLQISPLDLREHSTIERKHAIWELRFRSADPVYAKSIVNLWMQIGYAGMLAWQADGRIPVFVVLEEPTPAHLPESPIAYQQCNLLLAGSLAGLIRGILATSIWPRRITLNAQ